MRNPVEKRGCHLGVPEDRDPFAELQVGGDDNAGLFIELADEMEERCPAGFWEWNVSQLINDDAVRLGKLPDYFTSISFCLFLDQSVDEIDCILEPCPFPLIDEGCGHSNGNMGFAGTRATDKDQIMGLLCKLAGAKLFDLRLAHSGGGIVKCGKIPVVWELCDAHLIINGAHPPFDGFRLDQML